MHCDDFNDDHVEKGKFQQRAYIDNDLLLFKIFIYNSAKSIVYLYMFNTNATIRT